MAYSVDGVLPEVAVLGAVDGDGVYCFQPVQVLVYGLWFPAGVGEDSAVGAARQFAGAGQQEQDCGLYAGAEADAAEGLQGCGRHM